MRMRIGPLEHVPCAPVCFFLDPDVSCTKPVYLSRYVDGRDPPSRRCGQELMYLVSQCRGIDNRYLLIVWSRRGSGRTASLYVLING